MDVAAEALDEHMDQFKGRSSRLVVAGLRTPLHMTPVPDRARELDRRTWVSAPRRHRGLPAPPAGLVRPLRRSSARPARSITPRTVGTPQRGGSASSPRGDADTSRRRDDPGMPVPDDVRDSATGGRAAACCAVKSRSTKDAMAGKESGPLAAPSPSSLPRCWRCRGCVQDGIERAALPGDDEGRRGPSVSRPSDRRVRGQ